VLALVVGVALALRLAHLASVFRFEVEHVEPGLDRWLEIQIAQAVADGDPLGGPLAPYESSPAYATGLGMLYRIAGRSWRAPLVLQAVLGALVPLLLYGAGRRLVSPRVGILAAALAALYGPAMFYEALTLKFAMVPVVISALLCAAAIASRDRERLGAFAVGTAGAALVALRPNAVVVLPVVLAWIAAGKRPGAGARTMLLFAAGVAIVAGPVALRRTHADAASLWGIHFYIGSDPDGDGGYTVIPGIADDPFGHVDDARTIAEADVGEPLTDAAVSRYWFRRGLALIRARPADYAVLEWRKLRRIGAAGEDDAFGDAYASYVARSPVLGAGPVTFGVVAPLAVAGMGLAVARRSRLAWCVAFVAAYTVSLLAFFVTSRYRLPLVPPLVLCAALALAWLADTAVDRFVLAVAVGTGLLVGAWMLLGAPASDLLRLAVVLVAGVAAARALRSGDHGPT